MERRERRENIIESYVENTCFFFLLLQDFHEEYATEAFKKFDKDGAGFISALDFKDIMFSIKSHLLTKDIKDNLVAVSTFRTFRSSYFNIIFSTVYRRDLR